MEVCKDIDLTQPLTPEQRQMLAAVAARTAQPDEDCPELTDAQLAQMKRVADAPANARHRETVALRLSPQALRAAKALGDDYAAILSRILEKTLSDAELLKQYQ